jgi:hypothetical protein
MSGSEDTPPERSPDAIRAVLARHAGRERTAAFLAAYNASLDAARETLRLEAVTEVLNRWWPEAIAWQRDPEGERVAQRKQEELAQRYADEGLPPASERMTREQALAHFSDGRD